VNHSHDPNAGQRISAATKGGGAGIGAEEAAVAAEGIVQEALSDGDDDDESD
jgi:hypothetical protein